ncbi:hypothetical protein CACET_c15350 [Clostridium aceticum]|uniref:Uncharacterized protein n=1 Tax=Clostridium aceticum TaxID=84022 RepID=A0A0D8ID54_9CLOT|nr:helix-turn-helix transcriptional regulator [Clostridium aceticum]AKL94984.1 hypothetical protein CACET_c15350 [Clostridium aceticum]KJF27892.1 hypothetical protein TZ02_04750 [Clostridium aceticum]
MLNFLKNIVKSVSKYKEETKNNSTEKQNYSVDFQFKTTGVTAYNVKRAKIAPKIFYIDDDLFYIRTNVIKIREKKKITQKELCTRLGLKSTSFISRLERGDSSKITHEQVESLAKSLEIDISDLLIGYIKA